MNKFYGLALALISALTLLSQSRIAIALKPEQVNGIAREITVLIPSEDDGAEGIVRQNGSGVIIAREGNNYTVLTASHVLCKDYEVNCKNYYYELQVVTHDGKKYSLNPNSIRKLPEVDLVVFQFTSDRDYRLATLANYELADEQFIFASGWPDPKFVGKRERFFNVGKVLPKAISPLFKIFPPSFGYELIYTSVTYGGMSGGPVLDTEGRVIGIHGQNEGEKIKEVRVAIGFSLAIPITTFLKLAPQSGIQGQINVENSPPNTLSLQEIGDELYRAFEVPNNNDTNPLNWLNQGNKMWRLGQLALAYAAYEKALQLDAQLYQAWYGKGLVLTYWKRPQEALAAYEQALKINPNSDTAKKLRDKLQESLGGRNTPPVTPSQPTTAPTVEPSPQPSNPRRLW
ncbi:MULTISPECIES: tetratricopeptide repeat-containing serine protease family protein [unclassified Microcystis]|jgi:tetratricopeptide (TPR) repeat protein|uniref:tetratricopeptide repeat-containing S1 family peptidase n=1 Tax=Microcystis sp. TaxID=1127 RepID=UPI0022CC27FD|nr:trypsin-like peptidase domain-containing protein [Microcystis sp. LE17-20D]MCZ8066420.1 trypsin-like peptidase domain-containing protein [Microcystis sp. LE17-20D]MCZ8160237.1 trypsin-like peptidase domain-containing protein [Microcystis sp. LE19-196.1B]MCZ8273677.1 trypsin-like peptidase domain-containing protein [Microcystis sp. LE19-4.1E]